MDPISVVMGVAGLVAGFGVVPLLLAMPKKMARKKRKAKDNELRGVKVLLRPESPEIDICFVHGLTGDAKSTWTGHDAQENKDVFWPTDLLANQANIGDESFPRARIMLYGYERDVHSLCWLAERTLYHHASHFVEALTDSRKGCEKRPLLFVAHSLGGLLVKSALIYARGVDASSIAKGQDIYLSTFGIVSFGTPQTFAGDEHHISTLVDRLCRLPYTPTFEDFDSERKFDDPNSKGWKQDIELLQKRLVQYKPIASEIPEAFCYESNKIDRRIVRLSTREMTVPPQRLGFVHPSCQIVPIEQDHINICKFTSCNKDYDKVSGLIQKFFKESQTSLPRRRRDLFDKEDPAMISSGKVRDLGFHVESELPPNVKFVSRKPQHSREDYLDKLDKQLSSERFAVLTGGLGLGKTTLALEYAHRQKKSKMETRYTSVFWLNAVSELSLEESFIQIAQQLRARYGGVADQDSGDGNHPAFSPFLREGDRHFAIRAVLNWLSYPENKRWLLIYDDVEESTAPYLQDFLPPKNRGYILMTSRDDHMTHPHLKKDQITLNEARSGFDPAQQDSVLRGMNLDNIKGHTPAFMGSDNVDQSRHMPSTDMQPNILIRVGSFTRDESIDLLQNLYSSGADGESEPVRISKRKTFDQIAATLSDIPLDIAYAGAHLTSTGSSERIQAELDKIFEPSEDIPEQFSGWIDPFVMLGKAQDPIPVLLIQVNCAMDMQGVIDGLTSLHTLGWVWLSPDKQSFKIPEDRRRTRQMDLEANFHKAAENADLICRYIVETLRYLKNELKDESLRAQHERRLLKYIPACLDMCSKGEGFVTCKWDVLADFCERHGRYNEAAQFYYAFTRQHPENNDSRLRISDMLRSSQSEDALSDSWHEAKSFNSADFWNNAPEQSTLDSPHPTNKPNDMATIRTLCSKLGLIRMRIKLDDFRGLDGKCQEIYAQVETRTEERYAQLRFGVLGAMIHISIAQEEWLNAIQQNYRLIAALERRYGPSHENTIEAVEQLADIHTAQGNFGDAEPLLEQVRMTCQQLYGNGHPRTIAVFEKLARAYKEQGDFLKADESYRWIIKRYREQLGEDHIQTAKAKESLALMLGLMGPTEYKNADSWYESALYAAKLLGTDSEEYKAMLMRQHNLQKMRIEDANLFQNV